MKDKQEQIYMTINLPMSCSCVILEGKGKHYFRALKKANGDSSLLIKYLMLELAKPNGFSLTEEEIDEMHIRDISAISEVIISMMSGLKNEF